MMGQEEEGGIYGTGVKSEGFGILSSQFTAGLAINCGIMGRLLDSPNASLFICKMEISSQIINITVMLS